MRNLFVLVLCLICFGGTSIAQYNTVQNKIWAFGSNAGLNFNSGSPVPITTRMQTSEGCASVSDASGTLMFYSDGDTVFDRSGAVMPNGSHVTNFPFGTLSTAQGAQIVPVTGHPNQYYLFSLESYVVGLKRLEYCIVDMTLNGGMGDVIASTRSTLLDTGMGEHMISVQGNHCNVWLVTHMEDSTVFKVYNITAAGISAPVLSRIGTFTAYGGYSIGHFMVSPDRTKIVSTTFNNGSYVANGVGTELYDFDANTGLVSNCRVLETTDVVYGAEFSPDGTKLYTCQNNGSSPPTHLYQYDVSLSTAAAIVGSRYLVATSTYFRGVYPSLKLACDNKIYLGSMDAFPTSYLDCIATPNVGGSGCGYNFHAVTLATGTQFVFGFPNVYVVPGSVDTSFSRQDTSLCAKAGTVSVTAPPGYTDYKWASGTTGPVDVFTGTTNTVVLCDSGCHLTIDSVHVKADPYTLVSKVVDTFFCYPGKVTLTAPIGFQSTTWQDGTASPTFVDSVAGSVYVDGSSYCYDEVDTFHVVSRALTIDLGHDPTVCMNYKITVPLKGDHISYLWQDGSTDSVFYADHSDHYSVTVHQYGCQASASINVHFLHIDQNIPDTFVCKGQPFEYTVHCTVPDGGSVMWNDGVTTPDRTMSDSGTWFVYIKKDECEILDTVRVTTGYCSCYLDMPDAFTPNNDGLNDVFRPTIQPGCPVSGYIFAVFNRWGQEVFSSDMQHKGWDGTYKGTPCDMDTYMYTLSYYSGVHNDPVKKTGSVTLVR